MRMTTRFAAMGASLVAGLLLAAPAAAQDAPFHPRFRFGITAGANIADMSDTDGASTRNGMIAGGTLTMQLLRDFAVQPELLYAQKGVEGTFTDDETGERVKLTLKNDYVEMPVLARYTFPLRAPIRPFVLAGPSFALSANCEAEGSSGGVSASVDCDRFASLNDFDVGGIAGAGLEMPVGRNAVTLGARYEFGFSEVFDESTAKNRAWSILLGIRF